MFGILVSRGVPPGLLWPAFDRVEPFHAERGIGAALKIPAIIITLAGLAFYRGLALILADLGVANFSGNISFRRAITVRENMPA